MSPNCIYLFSFSHSPGFKKWLPNWLKNNFKNSTVKNAPLIRYLSALLDVHAQQGHKIRLQYVKGHAGIEGNEGADRLAVQGTTFPILEERDWDELARALKRGEDHLSWKVGKNVEIVDDDLEVCQSKLSQMILLT